MASTGCAPTAVSWESITASVPSRIALATSATSARVGREECTIESSICVAVIDGLASHPGELEQLLLHDRHARDRQLDAEVAARHHHAVGDLQDLLGALHRLRLLHLRDQRQARVLAHELDVLGRLHERQRHHVHADRLAVAQQLEILLGHRRQGGDRAGDVQPLARGHGAPHLHLDVDLVLAGAHRHDAQPHRAVGEVQDRVGLHGVGQAAPGDAHPRGIAGELLAAAERTSARSPGVSSTISSRSGPIRSLGPGRSCRIATGRPARPAASRTRRAVSACSSSVPWE